MRRNLLFTSLSLRSRIIAKRLAAEGNWLLSLMPMSFRAGRRNVRSIMFIMTFAGLVAMVMVIFLVGMLLVVVMMALWVVIGWLVVVMVLLHILAVVLLYTLAVVLVMAMIVMINSRWRRLLERTRLIARRPRRPLRVLTSWYPGGTLGLEFSLHEVLN
jgi:hypothetical protein